MVTFASMFGYAALILALTGEGVATGGPVLAVLALPLGFVALVGVARRLIGPVLLGPVQ